MYPDTFLHHLKQKIRPSWRFAFLSAFCTGLLTHLYRLTNHLLTWDSVYNFYDSQNKPALGRPFLTFSCGVGSYYDLQWVNGLLSLIYLSLTCICLTEIFSLKKKTSIFLLCGLTVTFPTVAGTFAYMYTADGYFLAQLTAALAVLVTLKYKKGFLAGTALLAFSYGSYQAYVSYAVMLILTWSILQLIYGTYALKQLARQWLRFFLMGVLGTVLYFLCSKLLTWVQGVAASDYNGISGMSLPDGAGLILAVNNCLIDFAYFFFGPLDRYNLFKLLNMALFFLLLLLLVRICLEQRLCQRPARLGLTLLCFAAMPFACSMIYFLSPQVRYYMLMYAGFCLIYMLPVLLSNNISSPSPAAATEKSPAEKKVFSVSAPLCLAWSSFLITGLIIFDFALTANISYLYMTSSNAKTFALVSRMTDRIEQLDAYESAEKLCMIGHFDDYDTISLNLPPAMAGVRDSYLISEQAHFAAMMDTYFGLSLTPCSDEDKEMIRDSQMFADMGCWPASDSVKQTGDTVVIKIRGE